MDCNFDTLFNVHLQEILYEAEKDHALAFIRKAQLNQHELVQLKLPHQLIGLEIPLQDCAISPSFSHSPL
jgi:hypothetical protein